MSSSKFATAAKTSSTDLPRKEHRLDLAMKKRVLLDLNRFFTFGSFGSDREDRNPLLPIATARYRGQFGQMVRFEDGIVMGDTPRGVACAKAFGAVPVAVATGNYDYEALRQTEADVGVRDLRRYMDWMQPWI
jgi:phosphoglycolate phosphatase-like HAD superfamily hydrolase